MDNTKPVNSGTQTTEEETADHQQQLFNSGVDKLLTNLKEDKDIIENKLKQLFFTDGEKYLRLVKYIKLIEENSITNCAFYEEAFLYVKDMLEQAVKEYSKPLPETTVFVTKQFSDFLKEL